MKPLHTSPSSALPSDVGGIVRRSPWGLAVVALFGLAGCLPASRGWVQEELASVQTQMAEVRDRVVVVEQQFGRLGPKVDRILAEMEQGWQQSIVSDQHPADTSSTVASPSPSPIPGNLPAEATLDLAITGRATPRVRGTTPPDCVVNTLRGEPCSGRTTPLRPASLKALKSPPPSRDAHSDCLLKTLKGEPC
jgi:hypothetical protein